MIRSSQVARSDDFAILVVNFSVAAGNPGARRLGALAIQWRRSRGTPRQPSTNSTNTTRGQQRFSKEGASSKQVVAYR